MTYDSLRRLKDDLRLDDRGADGEGRTGVRFGLWVLERDADGEFAWRLARVLERRPNKS